MWMGLSWTESCRGIWLSSVVLLHEDFWGCCWLCIQRLAYLCTSCALKTVWCLLLARVPASSFVCHGRSIPISVTQPTQPLPRAINGFVACFFGASVIAHDPQLRQVCCLSDSEVHLLAFLLPELKRTTNNCWVKHVIQLSSFKTSGFVTWHRRPY